MDQCEENKEDVDVLPDRHTLNAAEIPGALEYVLWEVPWMKRLYKVERSETVVEIINTGLERLPGRVIYNNLSWTNESLFDHITPGLDALEV